MFLYRLIRVPAYRVHPRTVRPLCRKVRYDYGTSRATAISRPVLMEFLAIERCRTKLRTAQERYGTVTRTGSLPYRTPYCRIRYAVNIHSHVSFHFLPFLVCTYYGRFLSGRTGNNHCPSRRCPCLKSAKPVVLASRARFSEMYGLARSWRS